ncbi:hypothetical protein CCR75_002597 [Bremia lactucae]|uniref:Uncharacterized protein n=1 Tax=Bremia lactucae TaxID=4779 RepID=A0A976P0C1_BRELC|nr:hypothetical protein CCR75_002597 [Bremia lactucae]
MAAVELLVVRIDHFGDRAQYVSILRQWLQELAIVNGRMITMGRDLQLLFIAATASQNSKLLALYRARNIDTNSRGELCIDKFIDILGRKQVQSCSCKGFLEMNVLSPMLLHKILVNEWHVEQLWLDTALATTRTAAFIEWKEAAKAARKERRKKERQEKDEMKKLNKEAPNALQKDANEKMKDKDLKTENNGGLVQMHTNKDASKQFNATILRKQQGMKRTVESPTSKVKKRRLESTCPI